MRDVRAMTDEELRTELDDSYRESMNLRFRGAAMQLPNVPEIKKTRKRIAQIKTVMRERELAKAAR
jgi:large subunit ribosomal protein L29